MKFDVPVVKDYLIKYGQVYTIRKYETKDKFTVTEVNDIGSCMVERIKKVESVDDLRDYVSLSGFDAAYDWWDKIIHFGAVNGWLYHVTVLENEKIPPLNDGEAEYAASHPKDPIQVITFTGNRNIKYEKVEEFLKVIHAMHPDATWISGMAYGLDLAVAKYAADHKIPFEAHLPFPAYIQTSKWNQETKDLHSSLLECACAVFTHSEKYSTKAFQVRNIKMAERADVVIAFNKQSKGGTVNMINYCKKSGIAVVDGFHIPVPGVI